MTMIITAHLEDCILIAADKRTMYADLETGKMRLETDEEQKIQIWCRGAIASTGETVFLDRIANHFINIRHNDTEFNQMAAINDEIEKRLLEGVPKEVLINNTIIFSMYDGTQTLLYSIPIKPFFQIFDKNGVSIARVHMDEIKKKAVRVSCYNLPPDMSNLQDFQRNLKPMEYFEKEEDFINYYIQSLKIIFALHASIDPCITSSFDLYIQSCQTGSAIALHIPNHTLPSPIPDDLNYWDKPNAF